MIKEDLRKIIDNKRHWGYVIDGAGDINWAVDESTCIRIAKGDNKIRFYEEIRSFLNNYYPQTDSDIIDEVFKYQHSRLSDPNKSYPFEEDFSYNIHDVIENGEVLQKKINKIKFDSKNYNSDIFNWAKEVLWYGRRVGRYKSTAELVG
jgi:hypothetical protein